MICPKLLRSGEVVVMVDVVMLSKSVILTLRSDVRRMFSKVRLL